MDGPSFHDERFVRDVAREIAREVTRDSHEAEDLAQEALLRSLTHPPREWTFPAAWLRQVARRIAIKRRRSESARREREERHVKREGGPAAPELLAKLEVARELKRALRSLDPLDRRILLLRYVENEPPRRIAKALGMPVETVRSRIKRALPRLRERLERGGKGKSAWLSSMLALFREEPRAGPFSAPWLPLGASAVLAGVILVPLLGGRQTPEPLTARSVPEGNERVAMLADERDPVRTELAPSGEAAAPRAEASLRVSLRWRDTGEPAAGVRARLETFASSGGPAAFGAPREARADDAGELRFGALEAGAWRLVPEHGRARALHLSAGEETSLELELSRGALVEGRVLLAEGRPAAGATLWLSWPERPGECEPRGETDAEGRFALAEVDREAWIAASLAGRQDSLLYPLRDPTFRRAEGEGLWVELELLEGPRHLLAEVVDPRGRPLAGVPVTILSDDPQVEKPLERRARYFLPPAQASDARGRVRFSGLHRGRYALVAHVAGHEPGLLRVAAFAREPAQARLERIQLGAGRALHARLALPGGEPAVGARVVLELDRFFEPRVAVADERGELVLENLPGCRVEARAELARAGATLGARASFPRGIDELRWEATLEGQNALLGRALGHDGSPLAGWRVRLTSEDGRSSEPAREELSDADGRFAFAGCAARAHRLELFAPDAPLPCGLLEGAQPGAREHELSPARHSSALAGWLVGAPRRASLWLVRAESSDERVELALSSPERGFRAEGLLAGPWRLELWEPARCGRKLADLELAEGERLELGALVAGDDGLLRVRVPPGVAESEVLLRESGLAGRTLIESARPDPEGWVEWSLPPGGYALRLGGSSTAAEWLEVALEPGARLELRPELGERHALELVLVPASRAEAGREAHLELVDARSVVRVERVLTLGAGPFSIPLELPAGAYRLRVLGGGRTVLAHELVLDGPARIGPLALGPVTGPP